MDLTTKKFITVSMGVLLVLALTLSCAAPAPAPTPSPTPSPSPTPTTSPTMWPPPGAKPMSLIVSASETSGGSGYALQAGFSALYNKYAKDSKMEVEVLGAVGNIAKTMSEGNAHLAIGTNSRSNMMYTGTIDGFEGLKVRLRWLWGGGSTGLIRAGFHTLANSGIKTFLDLKGKKVGAEGPQVPWAKDITQGMLAANGMTRNDIDWVVMSSADEAARDLLEGRLDAFVWTVGSAAQEIAASPRGLYLVPISDKELAEIQKLDPTMQRYIWKAGDIGQKEDKPFLAMVRSIVVTQNLDEYTAYYMAKIIGEHPDETKAIHATAGSFILENINSPEYPFSFPFHSGVIRYMKEIGKWGDTEKDKQKVAIEREKRVWGDVPDMNAFEELGIFD